MIAIEPTLTLSIIRPWPSLLLTPGAKDIENRTWGTAHRGWVLLHAGRRWDPTAVGFARQLGWEVSEQPDEHPVGIVGYAWLDSICTNTRHIIDPDSCRCGPWAMPGQTHWRLTRRTRLRNPVVCGGQLKLWRPTAQVMERVYLQLPEGALG